MTEVRDFRCGPFAAASRWRRGGRSLLAGGAWDWFHAATVAFQVPVAWRVGPLVPLLSNRCAEWQVFA